MFERYTEKARRTIFVGRWEASQFGSPYIETEHLLLGLLREDKPLNRLLRSHAAVQSIREQIEVHTVPGEKVSTSVDLPLSHECKRVLAYGAEEAQRLNHEHIGTPHLLLGVLREAKCFAAQLLREQGLTLESAREHVQPSETPLAKAGPDTFAPLDQWLAEREAPGGEWIVKRKRVGSGTTHFAIYPVDRPKGNEEDQAQTPANELEQVQRRIDFLVEEMERAVGNHEFERARLYSDAERKERENLRLLREQLNVHETPPRVPLLCIEIIREERFSEVQERCDRHIADGVTQVWLLEPHLKRAYTVTKDEGLRECRSGILQMTDPPLEMELRTVFD